MAKMIPNVNIMNISNQGERAFYNAALRLPDDYTVLYSLKYSKHDYGSEEQIKETDFVIIHPNIGFVVVEVKQGDIGFFNGEWCEFKKHDYKPLHKNPVDQARDAMFAILNLYKDKTKNRFQLRCKYAIAFPECNRLSGVPPHDLDENSIFLFDDMDNLENKVLSILNYENKESETKQTKDLINILSPNFKAYARLDDKIEMFHKKSEYQLTEEQQRILEETELDKRKIFFGAAGTGKTLIAMAKAKRLAEKNKKVLLTCYNRNLAEIQFKGISSNVKTSNFHDYLESVLKEKSIEFSIPFDNKGLRNYFDEVLPTKAFDYFMEIDENEKFDAIIVDEGQDFKDNWITTLESMLKEDGVFYIFADPNQSLFNEDLVNFKKMPYSKHKLTRNLRNSKEINSWITDIIPEYHLKSKIDSGIPVSYFDFKTQNEEKKKIFDEIGRLVSQGVSPKRITILSPNKKEKSCLKGVDKIKDWPLIDLHDNKPNGIKFSTIRSFKGLESDIVFLIGIKNDSYVCSQCDIYVGGSRARFLLYVFHEEGWTPSNLNDEK